MYEYAGAYIDCRCGRSFPSQPPTRRSRKKTQGHFRLRLLLLRIRLVLHIATCTGITRAADFFLPSSSSSSPIPSFSFLFFVSRGRGEGSISSVYFFFFLFFFPPFFHCAFRVAYFLQFSFFRFHASTRQPSPPPPVPRRKLDPVIILFDRSAVGPGTGDDPSNVTRYL